MPSLSLSTLLRRYLARRLLAPGIFFSLIFAALLGGQRWLDIQRAQALQAQNIAQYASTYLRTADDAVNFLAEMTSKTEFSSLAVLYRGQSQLFERVLLLNDRGEVLQAIPSSGAFRDYSRLMPDDLAKENKHIRLSAPYLSPLGNNMTVSIFSRAVDGKIVAGELNLVSLQNYIAGLEQAQPGVITFITDDFGTVIAHPDHAVVEQQTNLGHLSPVRRGLDEGTGFLGIHRMHGNWYLFSSANISFGRWVVFNTGLAWSQLQPLALALSVFVLILLFLLLTAIILLKRKLQSEVSSPLESFTRTLVHLEKGEQEVPFAGFPQKSFSELGVMQRQFSEMRQAIIRREQSLRDSERKFRRLIENLGREYFFFQRDREGAFLYLSPSVEAMLGYSPDELLGRADSGDIFPTPYNALAGDHSKDPTPPLETHSHEVKVRHKNGDVKLLEIVEVPMRDHQGSLIGLDGIARDITERKKAADERMAMERQLLHAQKLESLGILAGGIAHDFNNLLAAIMGNLELALMRADLGPAVQERLLQALQASRHATELTRQMLAYSGKGQFLVQKVNLSVLVQENLAMLQAVIPKNVTLNLRLAADLSWIIADIGQLQQIVLNLITNASEAIGDRPGTMTLVTGVKDFTAKELHFTEVSRKLITRPCPVVPQRLILGLFWACRSK